MEPVNFYKALADETRLKSLLLIQQQQELCVCELTTALNLSQPKISRHLAQLRNAGLLQARKHGQWVYYRIDDALPDWARTVLTGTLAANQSWLTPNTRALDHMADRPTDRGCCA